MGSPQEQGKKKKVPLKMLLPGNEYFHVSTWLGLSEQILLDAELDTKP